MLLASVQGQANLNLTLALKVVRTEAKRDDIVSERMQHWTQVFRSAVACLTSDSAQRIMTSPPAGYTQAVWSSLTIA